MEFFAAWNVIINNRGKKLLPGWINEGTFFSGSGELRVLECSGRAGISKEKVHSATSSHLPAISCIKLVFLLKVVVSPFVQPSLGGRLNWDATAGVSPSLVPGTDARPVPGPVLGGRVCTGLCSADWRLSRGAGGASAVLCSEAVGLTRPLSWALRRCVSAPCFYAGFQKATSTPVISPLLRK